MDVYNKEKRSYVMSKVKSKNTKPEEMVRKYLFSRGLRYHKNAKDLPGKPDIVLPKYKTIVFVNGCFWHGHNCKHFSLPVSNRDYWLKKISDNIKRDNETTAILTSLGWNVLVVWECQLKKSVRKNTLEYLYYNIVRNIKE
ncbi:MAG: very short patch repair endonuclease [Clostridiales bacterium]|nr:very short patch repair endonuclease [Clostridiales bacterium]